MEIESPVSSQGTMKASLISNSDPSSDLIPNKVPMILLLDPRTCLETISKIWKSAVACILMLAGPVALPAAGAVTLGLTKCINEVSPDIIDYSYLL